MALVRGLADSELVGEEKVFVAQEREARAEAATKGFLHSWRVYRHRGDAAIGDLGRLVELDQLLQLQLSLRSPRPSIEGQDQGAAVCHLCDGDHLPSIAGQRKRWEGVTDIEVERHALQKVLLQLRTRRHYRMAGTSYRMCFRNQPT